MAFFRPFTMNQTHFDLCNAIVRGGSIREAIAACGLSESYVYGHLLKKPEIQAYLADLRKRIEDETVMAVLQRKQRLSAIGRGEVMNHKVRTVVALDGVTTVTETETVVSDQIAAIKELSRMEGIGLAEGGHTSIDRRTLNITIVRSNDDISREAAASLAARINASTDDCKIIEGQAQDVESGSPLREDSPVWGDGLREDA